MPSAAAAANIPMLIIAVQILTSARLPITSATGERKSEFGQDWAIPGSNKSSPQHDQAVDSDRHIFIAGAHDAEVVTVVAHGGSESAAAEAEAFDESAPHIPVAAMTLQHADFEHVVLGVGMALAFAVGQGCFQPLGQDFARDYADDRRCWSGGSDLKQLSRDRQQVDGVSPWRSWARSRVTCARMRRGSLPAASSLFMVAGRRSDCQGARCRGGVGYGAC